MACYILKIYRVRRLVEIKRIQDASSKRLNHLLLVSVSARLYALNKKDLNLFVTIGEGVVPSSHRQETRAQGLPPCTLLKSDKDTDISVCSKLEV
eukprot:1388397-Amorphochlora_amoeboformis.AAC.1